VTSEPEARADRAKILRRRWLPAPSIGTMGACQRNKAPAARKLLRTWRESDFFKRKEKNHKKKRKKGHLRSRSCHGETKRSSHHEESNLHKRGEPWVNEQASLKKRRKKKKEKEKERKFNPSWNLLFCGKILRDSLTANFADPYRLSKLLKE